MSKETVAKYRRCISDCKSLFVAKSGDYGPSWLLFRLPSLTDQIFIKAKRIRTLEELQDAAKIPEGRDSEYRGIVNYCVMALIKLWCGDQVPSGDAILSPQAGASLISPQKLSELYDVVSKRTLELMLRKNHDYGEAWREMRLPSITDQIMVKIARLRTMESNSGIVKVSESADANYSDILNWSVFGLIKLMEADNRDR